MEKMEIIHDLFLFLVERASEKEDVNLEEQMEVDERGKNCS